METVVASSLATSFDFFRKNLFFSFFGNIGLWSRSVNYRRYAMNFAKVRNTTRRKKSCHVKNPFLAAKKHVVHELTSATNDNSN